MKKSDNKGAEMAPIHRDNMEQRRAALRLALSLESVKVSEDTLEKAHFRNMLDMCSFRYNAGRRLSREAEMQQMAEVNSAVNSWVKLMGGDNAVRELFLGSKSGFVKLSKKYPKLLESWDPYGDLALRTAQGSDGELKDTTKGWISDGRGSRDYEGSHRGNDGAAADEDWAGTLWTRERVLDPWTGIPTGEIKVKPPEEKTSFTIPYLRDANREVVVHPQYGKQLAIFMARSLNDLTIYGPKLPMAEDVHAPSQISVFAEQGQWRFVKDLTANIRTFKAFMKERNPEIRTGRHGWRSVYFLTFPKQGIVLYSYIPFGDLTEQVQEKILSIKKAKEARKALEDSINQQITNLIELDDAVRMWPSDNAIVWGFQTALRKLYDLISIRCPWHLFAWGEGKFQGKAYLEPWKEIILAWKGQANNTRRDGGYDMLG